MIDDERRPSPVYDDAPPVITVDDGQVVTADVLGCDLPPPDRCCPCEPGSILYVGDRLDNDIVPAASVGPRTALVKRGPWALIWQDDPDAWRVPDMRVDSLAELPR